MFRGTSLDLTKLWPIFNHIRDPRYITAESEEHSDSLVRRGLAFIVEHGFGLRNVESNTTLEFGKHYRIRAHDRLLRRPMHFVRQRTLEGMAKTIRKTHQPRR